MRLSERFIGYMFVSSLEGEDLRQTIIGFLKLINEPVVGDTLDELICQLQDIAPEGSSFVLKEEYYGFYPILAERIDL